MTRPDIEPRLFIGGEWLAPPDAARTELRDPATGKTIAEVPLAGPAELDAALAAAARGFEVWRRTPAYDRARVLNKAAALLRERIDHIAALMTAEQGKPLAEARAELGGTADHFEWFAEEGRRAYGRLIPSRFPSTRVSAVREPVGPVAAFAPWNFPAITPARKIAAALAAGCSCIIKAAEETPLTCLEMARALHDAGLPPGVLNVVFGVPAQVSEHLIRSDIIRKVSFTGSTAVGIQLAHLAAEGVKRITLELGGHAPVIVFADADVEAAARLGVAAKYRNAGQVCVSPTRFQVHDSVFDQYVARFTELASALVVGDGRDAATQMGPLANPRRIAAMEALIGDARDHQARVATGGRRIDRAGNFFEPTVLTDVPVGARIMNEEPFGPVAVINRFSTIDEALAEANRLPYGLAAYGFTRSSNTALLFGERIESGIVGINTFAVALAEVPFGGVKASGYGTESASEGLDAYLTTKAITEFTLP